jgi:hypothetical protein
VDLGESVRGFEPARVQPGRNQINCSNAYSNDHRRVAILVLDLFRNRCVDIARRDSCETFVGGRKRPVLWDNFDGGHLYCCDFRHLDVDNQQEEVLGLNEQFHEYPHDP